MRRSLRDSIVGFSLIGGILIFTFFSFWLRGLRLSSKNWHLFAEFNNASGLSKKSIHEIVRACLAEVGLFNVENKLPNELSGGMQKRVSFARALITDQTLISNTKPLLLFDEPTAGLDPIASSRIEDLINKTNDKASGSSIVVSHVLSTIERTSDKVLMLYGGKFRCCLLYTSPSPRD